MEPGAEQEFDAVFANIEARFDEQSRSGLICKQGSYKACSVLKLQKPSWTNDPMDRLENTSGIFFSIWTNDKSIMKNQANYNIHALKLRDLKGYSIKSLDFAFDFRNAFASMRGAWPNVRVEGGPQTLMEGWIKADSVHFEKEVLDLMDGFESLSPLIDRLLESRR
jgi:hypothetical protein